MAWFRNKKTQGKEVVIVEGPLKISKPRAQARLERLKMAEEKHGTLPESMAIEIKVLELHLEGSS